MSLQTERDEDCPFCKIARGGDASAEIVCEADDWVAFFPPKPATPGHTLVIPRVHVPDLWAVEPPLGAHLLEAVVRVGNAITRALEPDGMNLISSSGTAAEQSVFHLHLHVVPRWPDDDIGQIWPPKKPIEESFKEDVAIAVRAACADL